MKVFNPPCLTSSVTFHLQLYVSTLLYIALQAFQRSTTRTCFLSWLQPSYTTLHRSAQPPSLSPSIPQLPPLVRAIESELKPYPFYTTEERTAITWRTNRRVALFNSKANKKLADRGWIRQGKGDKKRLKKKDKLSGKEFSSAIYSAENFPRMCHGNFM